MSRQENIQKAYAFDVSGIFEEKKEDFSEFPKWIFVIC